MVIYGVRSSPYENYEAYFTTNAGAENYIINAIEKQRKLNLEYDTDFHYEDELYTEEIEVN